MTTLLMMAENGLDFRWFYTELADLFQICYATGDHFHVLINFLFISCFFVFIGSLQIEGNVCRVPLAEAREGQNHL